MTAPAAGSAVVFREAARTSRRWQTYGLRVLFTGVLMATLVAGLAVNERVADLSEMGRLGRGLFIAFTVVQLLLAGVLSPLLSARAVIEERVEDTLDLLVLSRLPTRRLFRAKVAARLLLLFSVVIGGVPVYVLVLSMGGVAPVEVVTVAVGTVTMLVMTGVLGAFFALFTRSPLFATVMTVPWVFLVWVLLPLLVGLLTVSPRGGVATSVFAGPLATDWTGLVLPLGVLPPLWLTLALAGRVFERRTARAGFLRLFDAGVWGVKPFLAGGALLLVWSVTGGVIGVALALGSRIAAMQGSPSTGWIAGAGLVWITFVGWVTALTWVYLRVGSDLVLSIDAAARSTTRGGVAIPRAVRVWSNPVAWRETRARVWGPTVTAGLVGWLLFCIVFAYSMLWLVPGGLLFLGAATAAAAILLAIYLASASIEGERRDGTLPLLLTTRVRPGDVFGGKLLGVAIPTLPLLVLSFPMLVVGVPYLAAVMQHEAGEAVLTTLLACGWLLVVWFALSCVSMLAGLRAPTRRAAFPTTLAALGAVVALPTLAAWLLADLPLLAAPFRLVAPVVAPSPRWWEIVLSGFGWGAVGLVVAAVLVVRMRVWGGADR